MGLSQKSLQIRLPCSSIFRRSSEYYLLYLCIEMCKSHESGHNSFLDSKLKEPNIPSNLPLLPYQDITQIFMGMKLSGSPCSLDQISIICFKRCPYLRSFILNVCTEVLTSNTLPVQWTKAVTIFIHKKGKPVYLRTSD